MNLGSAIKTMRTTRKLKQTVFAKKVGISQVTMSYIETGKSTPSTKNLKAIARVLRVPVPMLYILAINYADVPKKLHPQFKKRWPAIKNAAAKVFFKDPKNFK